MKPESLLILGAYCQKKYQMEDNFKIMNIDGLGCSIVHLPYDDIFLDKVYCAETNESAWVGYF